MDLTGDRAQNAFGNQQDKRTYKKAVRGKQGFIKRFGDDSDAIYHLAPADVPVIGDALGVRRHADLPAGAVGDSGALRGLRGSVRGRARGAAERERERGGQASAEASAHSFADAAYACEHSCEYVRGSSVAVRGEEGRVRHG